MANTGLDGPYILTSVEIDRVITKISPGTYALGTLNQSGTFVVHYVGRSDSDLNARLQSWVGKKPYTHFKALYYSTPKGAFEKECSIYHDFQNLDNEIHPDRPKNQFWSCLICTIFD